MGEAAKVAGDGGSPTGNGGAGNACALRRGCRATGLTAQHTAAGRRIRPRRTSAAASPLSASRADEEQLPASAEQVRERRAGVGGCGGRRCGGRRCGCGRCGRGGQEGRAAAEGDALVGSHRHAAAAAVPAGERAATAALRDGPAPRRALAPARRVTPPPSPISRLHSIIGTIGLTAPRRVSRSIIDSVFIYLGRGAARPSVCVPLRGVRPCSLRRRRVER